MEVLSLSERVKENLAMAQSLELVTMEKNSQSGRMEVRMHMRRQNQLPSSLILGSNWEDAVQFLSDPANQVVRETFENALGQANLQKFQQLASACFRNGEEPSKRDLQLLERFRQKYAISEQRANSILSHLRNTDVPAAVSFIEAETEPVLSKPIHSQPLWIKVGTAVLVVGLGAALMLFSIPSTNTPVAIPSKPSVEGKGTQQVETPKFLATVRTLTGESKRTVVAKPKRLSVLTLKQGLVVPVKSQSAIQKPLTSVSAAKKTITPLNAKAPKPGIAAVSSAPEQEMKSEMKSVLPVAPVAPAIMNTSPEVEAPAPKLVLPKPRLRRQPAYPELATHNAWEGRVILNAYIREDGSVGEVQLVRSSGHGELDDAAIEAMHQWKFEPAHLGDQPVGHWTQVPFNFSLQ